MGRLVALEDVLIDARVSAENPVTVCDLGILTDQAAGPIRRRTWTSAARIVFSCPARNVRQVSPARRGSTIRY
jgi:hypothetical protein